MDADTGVIKKSAKALPRRNVRKCDYLNLFMRACTEWRDDMRSKDYYEEIVKNGHHIYVNRPYKKPSWSDQYE
jgi:hypothetical protein